MSMNDFFYGMSTIGDLFPPVPGLNTVPNPGSAWKGVANSFAQVGDNIRAAIKSAPHVQQNPKRH
jgi:hypothetical protein